MEMPREAVLEEYNRALKQGQREVAELSAQGKPTNPAVLDDILPDGSANAVQDLGVLELPAQRILGTKSAGSGACTGRSNRPGKPVCQR